jgi:hypothetical protein
LTTFEDVVHRVRLIDLALATDVLWAPEREDVLELRKLLMRTVREIDTATQFPARPGPQCNSCVFRLRCVERTRVSLDELVPVEGLPWDE